ncbi:MAG: glycosyltransferase family 4 protein, partial [Deltaproteobacteria bacterium]|nr:glycosyltransferase family 4 protein [Deltaproteobacteria bacterium]
RNEKEINWLFIGRLKEEKGVQFLPLVWKRLGAKAPLLHIVGDGPYLETLKSEINSLGLDKKIILHGHCSSEQVTALPNRFRIFLAGLVCWCFHPSAARGFPW